MSIVECVFILLIFGLLIIFYCICWVMMVDWGFWDSDFNEFIVSVCQCLLKIVGGEGSYICVLLQGSGIFVVEVVIGILVLCDGKVLVLINGVYGKCLVKICEVL